MKLKPNFLYISSAETMLFFGSNTGTSVGVVTLPFDKLKIPNLPCKSEAIISSI